MFKINGELLNLIDCTVKKTVSETVSDLKRQQLLVEGKQTPFQKTETLLFNYTNFQSAIKEKEEQIADLKGYGLNKKSNSITSFTGNAGYIDVKSEQDKVDERIESIEASIHTTKTFIRIIDDALAGLQDDPYYDLISMRYFEKCSREEIAEHFDCDVRTTNRQKNRLVNRLAIVLFSDEVIEQIFSL